MGHHTKKVFTKNGRHIYCYGNMREEQNTYIVYTDNATDEVGEALIHRGFVSWEEAVTYVTMQAEAHGHTVEEISAV